MRKRLRWLPKLSPRLFPGRWQIRNRLLTAGLVLSFLSLGMPAYMRLHLQGLAGNYASAIQTWNALGEIHDFSSLLTETESQLRAVPFATEWPTWKNALNQNFTKMDLALVELRKSAAGRPERDAIISEVSANYERWLVDTARPLVEGRRPARGVGRALASDPGAYHIHRLLSLLSKRIRERTTLVSDELARKAHATIVTVTAVGVFFFLGFIGLMLSLWTTLIPGLGELLNAARELKKGHLDHRVHIGGVSETAQLGRAFNEMAVSLKAQNEKLKALNRIKSDFVSTVSHELRTPLTAIKGSIGLILGGVTGKIPTETVDMLGITEKNTDRLIRLINEVLDIAKIEAGEIRMKFDKTSVAETVGHAIQSIQAVAQTSGIELVWEAPEQSPLVVLDRDRIEQVVTNLLSNAIKFTDRGGHITVRLTYESDRVIVEVQDTGEGIPEEFLERIFQKFQQAGSAAHKAKEGTGLGLTIARAIVEEHGGTIWVQSRQGAGSTFSFSLPWNGTDFVDSTSRRDAA